MLSGNTKKEQRLLRKAMVHKELHAKDDGNLKVITQINNDLFYRHLSHITASVRISVIFT
jgi:ribosomal protein L31E